MVYDSAGNIGTWLQWVIKQDVLHQRRQNSSTSVYFSLNRGSGEERGRVAEDETFASLSSTIFSFIGSEGVEETFSNGGETFFLGKDKERRSPTEPSFSMVFFFKVEGVMEVGGSRFLFSLASTPAFSWAISIGDFFMLSQAS